MHWIGQVWAKSSEGTRDALGVLKTSLGTIAPDTFGSLMYCCFSDSLMDSTLQLITLVLVVTVW